MKKTTMQFQTIAIASSCIVQSNPERRDRQIDRESERE